MYDCTKQDETSERNKNLVNFIQKKIGKHEKHALCSTRLLTDIGHAMQEACTQPKKKN